MDFIRSQEGSNGFSGLLRGFTDFTDDRVWQECYRGVSTEFNAFQGISGRFRGLHKFSSQLEGGFRSFFSFICEF